MEQIKKWLNEKGSYGDGVKLLLHNYPDHDLVDLFTAEGESDYKKKRLYQALMDLVKNSPLKKEEQKPDPVQFSKVSMETAGGTIATRPGQLENVTIQSSAESTRKPGRWSMLDARDEVEKQLHQVWHPMFLERNHLQDVIYQVAKDGKKDPAKKKEAEQMAFRILHLDRSIREIYKQRDQYFLDGTRPVDPDAEQYAQDPITAVKKLDNHVRYVRTFKKKLEQDPTNEKFQKLLDKHQAAVTYYKNLLNIQ